MLWSVKISALKSQPPTWWYYEVATLEVIRLYMNKICTLIFKRPTQPLYHWRHKKASCMNQEVELISHRICAFTLDFSGSGTWEINFCYWCYQVLVFCFCYLKGPRHCILNIISYKCRKQNFLFSCSPVCFCIAYLIGPNIFQTMQH